MSRKAPLLGPARERGPKKRDRKVAEKIKKSKNLAALRFRFLFCSLNPAYMRNPEAGNPVCERNPRAGLCVRILETSSCQTFLNQ